MAYDEALAERVRDALGPRPDLTERAMFGGLAFLLDGRMALAVSGSGGLMMRADPTEVPRLLESAQAEPVVMRGREMTGWVRVPAEGLTTEAELDHWVELGLAATPPGASR